MNSFLVDILYLTLNDQVLAVGQKLLMKLKKTLLLTVQSIEFSDLSTVGGATDGSLTQVRWL